MIFKSLHSKGQTQSQSLNVVPFIDVLLVLVILLMSAQVALVETLTIDLPKTQRDNLDHEMFTTQPLVIFLDQKRNLYIQNDFIDKEQLDPEKFLLKLTALEKQKSDSLIYFQADHQCSYQDITEVLDLIKLAGFEKVTLVSESENDS